MPRRCFSTQSAFLPKNLPAAMPLTCNVTAEGFRVCRRFFFYDFTTCCRPGGRQKGFTVLHTVVGGKSILCVACLLPVMNVFVSSYTRKKSISGWKYHGHCCNGDGYLGDLFFCSPHHADISIMSLAIEMIAYGTFFEGSICLDVLTSRLNMSQRSKAGMTSCPGRSKRDRSERCLKARPNSAAARKPIYLPSMRSDERAT